MIVVVISLGLLYVSMSIDAGGAPRVVGTPSYHGHPMTIVPSSQLKAAEATTGPLGCPLPTDQCYFSYNWAGYAVLGAPGSVTQVTGSWVVPTVVGSHGQYCPDGQRTWDSTAVWIGIDGATDPTVEQTGTSSDCFYGQVDYYPWFEYYPAEAEEPIPTADFILPGDHMTASVDFEGLNATGIPTFQTTLTDLTQKWTFSSPVTAVVGALQESAEWIEESPYYMGFLGLTDVSLVTFSDATATVGGTTGSFASFGPNVIWILSVDYQFPYATPPTLYYAKALPLRPEWGGSAFSLEWLSSGP